MHRRQCAQCRSGIFSVEEFLFDSVDSIFQRFASARGNGKKKEISNNSTTRSHSFMRFSEIVGFDVPYRPMTSVPVIYFRFRH